jgi:hypothetical protein
MPLQLRRVLEANYRVTVESSDRLLAKVNSQVQKRRLELQAKGSPLPPAKNATVLAALQGRRPWDIRAIDLLHKIGFVTTPGWVNMARLSASWATRRYFWAIGEPDRQQQPNLRLSDDARRMDFHQKTLLSDEFGIGMGGLLMESFFGAGSFVDISIALNDPAAYQGIQQDGDAQPDYLMWGNGPDSPYYVVECKGTQTSRAMSHYQMRRGLEQVPSVVLGAGPRQVMTVVVATCLLGNRTEVLVLDPPPDKPDDKRHAEEASERVSERTGERSWRISNAQAFHERTIVAEESNLLKWAGQYQTAVGRDRRLERLQPELLVMPNAPLETKRTNVGNFRGIEQPLFPALGRNLRIFTGVEEDLLESLIQDRPRTQIDGAQVRRAGLERQPPDHLPATTSVSRSGSCMIIDGF